MGFFDHRSGVWEVLIVLPSGHSVFADDGINLGLCLSLHLGIRDQGLDGGREHRGGGIRATFDSNPCKQHDLVFGQAMFLLLIEYTVQHAVDGADCLSAPHHGFQEPSIEVVQSIVNFQRSGNPISKETLRDPFQEWEDINRRCCTKLIDSRPYLRCFTKLFRMGCADGGRSNSIDCE